MSRWDAYSGDMQNFIDFVRHFVNVRPELIGLVALGQGWATIRPMVDENVPYLSARSQTVPIKIKTNLDTTRSGEAFLNDLKLTNLNVIDSVLNKIFGGHNGNDRSAGAQIYSGPGQPANSAGPPGALGAAGAEAGIFPDQITATQARAQSAGRLNSVNVSRLMADIRACVPEFFFTPEQVRQMLQQAQAVALPQRKRIYGNPPSDLKRLENLRCEGIHVGTLVGYRAWKLEPDQRLFSTSRRFEWLPGAIVEGKPDLIEEGIHAYKSMRHILKEFVGPMGHARLIAYGRVELMGRVYEHEFGYRAEKAKIIGFDGIAGPMVHDDAELEALREKFLPEQVNRRQDQD